jgi:hypothetical protein
MIHRIISVTLFLLLFTCSVNAQTQQIIPIYSSKNLKNNTLKIYSDSGSLNIAALKGNVIKLTFFDKLAKSDMDSLTSSSKSLNIRVTQNLDDIFFATDSLWVVVNKFDLSVRFLKKQNEELLLKCNSYFLNNADKSISFALQENENLTVVYLKKLNKGASPKLKKLHGISKKFNPLIVSEKGYALCVKKPSRNKVKITTKNNALKVDERFVPKTFLFLSGSYNEIDKNLKLNK